MVEFISRGCLHLHIQFRPLARLSFQLASWLAYSSTPNRSTPPLPSGVLSISTLPFLSSSPSGWDPPINFLYDIEVCEPLSSWSDLQLTDAQQSRILIVASCAIPPTRHGCYEQESRSESCFHSLLPRRLSWQGGNARPQGCRRWIQTSYQPGTI